MKPVEQILAGIAAVDAQVNNCWQRIDGTWNVRLRREGTIVAEFDGVTLAEALDGALRQVREAVDLFA